MSVGKDRGRATGTGAAQRRRPGDPSTMETGDGSLSWTVLGAACRRQASRFLLADPAIRQRRCPRLCRNRFGPPLGRQTWTPCRPPDRGHFSSARREPGNPQIFRTRGHRNRDSQPLGTRTAQPAGSLNREEPSQSQRPCGLPPCAPEQWHTGLTGRSEDLAADNAFAPTGPQVPAA